MKLNFYDVSRKLAGDRWYVGMIAQIDIPLTDSLLTNQPLSNYSAEEIRNALGETIRFQKKMDRHFIAEGEKDALVQGLVDSYIKSSLSYLSHPNFSIKYVHKEFTAHLKQQAWHKGNRYG